MKKRNDKFFAVILLFILSACSNFPKSEKSKFSAENKYILTFVDNEGKVFSANLGVKTKYLDATKDLNAFRHDFYATTNQRFFARMEEMEKHVNELKQHSASLTRRLAAALAIALLVPIPGAFETTLTIGLVYVTYKKLTETDDEKFRKKHVESLIEECLSNIRRLRNFQTYTLIPFPFIWEKEFQEEQNHFVNVDDETDIRLLDSIMERYLSEKESLKIISQNELLQSQHHCSNVAPPKEDNIRPKKKTSQTAPKN